MELTHDRQVFTVDIVQVSSSKSVEYVAILFDSTGEAIHDGTGDTPAAALHSLVTSRVVDWGASRRSFTEVKA